MRSIFRYLAAVGACLVVALAFFVSFNIQVPVAGAQVSANYWKLLSGILQPNLSTWQFEIPQLGGNGTKCVHVNNSGLFSTASADCGSGSGNSLASSSPWTAGQVTYVVNNSTISSTATTSVTCTGSTTCTSFNVLGSSPITINSVGSTQAVSTSTNETAGQVAYWSTTSGSPAKLNSVATTTLTGSGVVSISNSPIVIGASGAVATITGGSNGQVLAWLAGVPAWAATSTNSCSGVTCTYNSGTWTFSIANNAITTGMLATLAANNVLGNNTGATGNVVAVATSTFFGADYPINSSGKTGIATSSPWGLLSINPVQQVGSAPSFAIGSSSGQIFNIDNTGAMNLFTNNATSTWNDKYGTTLMSLFTGSTTGPAFTVIATTSTPSLPVNLFSIDQYGHLMASSTPNTPTVSCSPSGGTLSANSNDTTGSITTGTLSVSCALTFSRAYSQTPLVFVTQSGTASIFGVSSRSTTAFTVTLGTAATGDVLQYFVIMP